MTETQRRRRGQKWIRVGIPQGISSVKVREELEAEVGEPLTKINMEKRHFIVECPREEIYQKLLALDGSKIEGKPLRLQRAEYNMSGEEILAHVSVLLEQEDELRLLQKSYCGDNGVSRQSSPVRDRRDIRGEIFAVGGAPKTEQGVNIHMPNPTTPPTRVAPLPHPPPPTNSWNTNNGWNVGKGKGEKGGKGKGMGQGKGVGKGGKGPPQFNPNFQGGGSGGKAKGKGGPPPSTAAVLVCFACQASGVPSNHDYRSCPASLAVLAAKMEKMMQSKEAQDKKMSEASSSNNPPQQ